MKNKRLSDIRFLNITAIIGAALILGLEVWNLYSVSRNHSYAAWVNHTHQVIESSDELLSSVVITESWARGYAASHHPSFLRSYYQSKQLVMPLINQLARLTIDDSLQQHRIDTLRALADQRMNQWDKTISIITDSAGNTAELGESMIEGSQISSYFRIVNQRLKNHEEILLDERLIFLENEYGTFRTLIIIASSLSLAILFTLYIILWRQMERRIKTEEELFISREWFSKTLASLGDGVIATDITGIITFLNGVAEKLTGWSKEEAIGKPLDFVFDIVNEFTGLPVTNPLKKAMQERQIVLMANHTVLNRKDKSQLFIDDSAAPVLNDHGDLAGAVLIFRDVTEQVQIRRKLNESENRLRKIIENSTTIITIRDKEGRYQMVNPAFEKIFGLKEAEVIGKKHVPYIELDDLKKVNTVIQKVLETDSIITSEEERIVSDGSIRQFIAVRFPLKDAEGNIVGIGGISTDITEQRLRLQNRYEMVLQEKMNESETHYKELANSISEMFFSVDRNERFVFWNHACERQTGRHEEEVLGKKMEEVFPTQEFLFLKNKFQYSLRKNKPETFTSEFRNNGRVYNYSVHVYPDSHGISVLMSDVTTELKSKREATKLVENLQQKNKDLRQFAYIISHNLRSPIAKIQGLAELFGEESFNDFNGKIIDNISVELKNLDQVVNDLTDIISIREVEYKSKELISLTEEMKQVKMILSEEINSSNATIFEDFSASPTVHSIKSYLHSILINLIGNSLKYSSPHRKPTIRVTSKIAEHLIMISVEDNGMGINLAKHGAKLFTLYKRFHNHVHGRGIGLYLVKNQAESLGGKVEVESKIDQGTTFKVYLPINVHSYEENI